jgi:hypothetical protein
MGIHDCRDVLTPIPPTPGALATGTMDHSREVGAVIRLGALREYFTSREAGQFVVVDMAMIMMKMSYVTTLDSAGARMADFIKACCHPDHATCVIMVGEHAPTVPTAKAHEQAARRTQASVRRIQYPVDIEMVHARNIHLDTLLAPGAPPSKTASTDAWRLLLRNGPHRNRVMQLVLTAAACALRADVGFMEAGHQVIFEVASNEVPVCDAEEGDSILLNTRVAYSVRTRALMSILPLENGEYGEGEMMCAALARAIWMAHPETLCHLLPVLDADVYPTRVVVVSGDYDVAAVCYGLAYRAYDTECDLHWLIHGTQANNNTFVMSVRRLFKWLAPNHGATPRDAAYCRRLCEDTVFALALFLKNDFLDQTRMGWRGNPRPYAVRALLCRWREQIHSQCQRDIHNMPAALDIPALFLAWTKLLPAPTTPRRRKISAGAPRPTPIRQLPLHTDPIVDLALRVTRYWLLENTTI